MTSSWAKPLPSFPKAGWFDRASFYRSVAVPIKLLKLLLNEVIVNFPLSNEAASEKFGKDGYKIVEVPSEKGKDLPKNYLRTLPDPSK